MNILGVDTSSSHCVVAVRIRGRWHTHEKEGGWRHLQHVIPTIHAVFKKAKCTLADINLLVCTNGPGSFTGLRIGFATIKGLVAASGLPYRDISMLEVYQHQYSNNLCYAVVMPISRVRGMLAYWHNARPPLLFDLPYSDMPARLIHQLNATGHSQCMLYIRGEEIMPIIMQAHASIPESEKIALSSVCSIAQSLLLSAESCYHRYGESEVSAQPSYFRLIDAERYSSELEETLGS